MEFFTRSPIAHVKNSRVKTGLCTGSWQVRSVLKMASRSCDAMRPKTLDKTVI